MLEKAVTEREGKVALAKLDTDANPRVVAEHRIQSIPAVKAFRDGEVVAEFIGAQPGPQVERFLDALVPSEAEELVAAGDEADAAPGARARARPRRRRRAARPPAAARGEREEALELLGERPRLVRRRRARRPPAARGRTPELGARSPRSTPASSSAAWTR